MRNHRRRIHDLGGPVVGLDASDSSLVLESAAQFTGVDANFLQVPAHADFDYSGSKKGAMGFVFRAYDNIADNIAYAGAKQAILGCYNGGNSNFGFLVSRTRHDMPGGPGVIGVEFSVCTGAGVGRCAMTFPGFRLLAEYSYCLITFDYTQSGESNKIKIYLDSVLQTLAFEDWNTFGGAGTGSQAMPSNPTNTSALPFNIGTATGDHNSFPTLNAMINRVQLWNGYVPTQSDVNTIYNGGRILYGAALKLTGIGGSSLKMALDLTEASGTRADSINSHNAAEQGAGIGRSYVCTGYIPAFGRTKLALNPTEYTSTGVGVGPTQSFAFCGGLEWIPNSINGFPAFRFGRTMKTLRALGAGAMLPSLATAELFTVLKINDSPTYSTAVVPEGWLWNTASESDTTNSVYFGQMIVNGQSSNIIAGKTSLTTSQWGATLRLRNTPAGASLDDEIYSTTPFTVGKTYVDYWRILGTGGAASIIHRLNGAGDTITALSTSTYNKGPRDVYPMENFTLGTPVRNEGVRLQAGNPDTLVSAVYIYPGLPSAQALAIESTLCTKYNAT